MSVGQTLGVNVRTDDALLYIEGSLAHAE
jgi:hypothetical protein